MCKESYKLSLGHLFPKIILLMQSFGTVSQLTFNCYYIVRNFSSFLSFTKYVQENVSREICIKKLYTLIKGNWNLNKVRVPSLSYLEYPFMSRTTRMRIKLLEMSGICSCHSNFSANNFLLIEITCHFSETLPDPPEGVRSKLSGLRKIQRKEYQTDY